jgi:proline iminopeptidase
VPLKLLIISGWLVAGSMACRCAAVEAVSINRSEKVQVDGAKLYVLIRGADRTAPVLLWLHGGPGAAERPLFRYFNGDLERHFVAVYWDQRGAGRSFDSQADPHRLTVAQHLADMDAVVDRLRRDLGRDRVILVGHSWGAALGLLYAHAHPDKVSTLLAVNPLVSKRAAEQSEYDFVVEQASQHQDTRTLARVRALGTPPYASSRDALVMETLVQQYGGIYHNEPHRFWVVSRAILMGLVTPWEIRRIIHANNVSLEAMNNELLDLDLRVSVPRLPVPVVFFLGRHDRHVDASFASNYFAALRAPAKRLVWFDNSAHNVPFEEAARFNATVLSELQSSASHSRSSLRCPTEECR